MSDKNTFNLLGSPIEYTIEDIDIYKLKYFPGNPRVYAVLRKISDKDPNQEQIEELMFKEEHVRELLKRIKRAGGLLVEIIVRRDTMEVVEGNSRLAAYRILDKKNSGKGWDKISCKVVETLSKKQMRSLLAEFHIHGITEWSTYAQSNMLYIENIENDVSIDQLEADTSLKGAEINKRIEIIKLMEKNCDNKEKHYSHYDQILTKKSLKEACSKHIKFKERLLEEIKNEKIGTAMDVRDKLSIVCERMKSPAFKKYTKGELDLEDAYDLAINSGAGDTSIKRLRRFKAWVTDLLVSKNLINQRDHGQVKYEVGKIQTALKKIQEGIKKKESNNV